MAKNKNTTTEVDLLIKKYNDKLRKKNDMIAQILILEDIIRELIGIENITIALIGNAKMDIPTQSRSVPLDFEHGGILQEPYHTKVSHSIKNARMASVYRKNIDNPSNKKIKDVLSIPISDKQDNVYMVIQLASDKEYDKTFSSADTDLIMELFEKSDFEKIISESKEEEKTQTLESEKELIITSKSTGTNSVNLKTINILVIDDSYIILKYFTSILKKYKANTIIADTAKEAIKIFKQKKIDFIFIDEFMPSMLGHEAIKLIRNIEKEKEFKSIPIIAVTSDTISETKKKMIDAGATEVVCKPLYEKQLIEIIQKYITNFQR